MFLFIDANVIVANPLLRGRHWDSVADAVVRDVMDLYVPRLAVDEAVARYREKARARERDLRKQLHDWPLPARGKLELALTESAEFAADYEATLLTRLEQMGAELVGYPHVAHEEVARRAVTRLAPFDAGGSGYRDALHWFAFLDLVESLEHLDSEAYLLSSDKAAFGPHQREVLEQDVENLGTEWEVTFLSHIHEFAVPDQFMEEEGSLDFRQDADLREAVRDALRAGGSPSDFTGVLAQNARHDTADIVTVRSLSVDADRVLIERRSGDLWVSFTASALCEIQYETTELLDEEAGDLAFFREPAVLQLQLVGNAYSTGSSITEVSTLKLTGWVDPTREPQPS